MTQMGLDYLKHRENVRHNMASEDVERRNATSNERNASSNEVNALSNRMNADSNARNAASNEKNAQTNQYVASFKDREVTAQERNASSNERNATANERNAATNEFNAQTKAYEASIKQAEYDLEQKYKEREMAAKELSAEGTYIRGLASQVSANADKKYKETMAKIDANYKQGMLDYYDRVALVNELEQRADQAYKEGTIDLKTRDQLGTLGKILESNASYYGDDILGGFVAGLGSSIYQLVTDFF